MYLGRYPIDGATRRVLVPRAESAPEGEGGAARGEQNNSDTADYLAGLRINRQASNASLQHNKTL